jgi:mevalonate kinase
LILATIQEEKEEEGGPATGGGGGGRRVTLLLTKVQGEEVEQHEVQAEIADLSQQIQRLEAGLAAAEH